MGALAKTMSASRCVARRIPTSRMSSASSARSSPSKRTASMAKVGEVKSQAFRWPARPRGRPRARRARGPRRGIGPRAQRTAAAPLARPLDRRASVLSASHAPCSSPSSCTTPLARRAHPGRARYPSARARAAAARTATQSRPLAGRDLGSRLALVMPGNVLPRAANAPVAVQDRIERVRRAAERAVGSQPPSRTRPVLRLGMGAGTGSGSCSTGTWRR